VLLDLPVTVGYFGVLTLLYTAVADTLPARGVAIAVAIGGVSLAVSAGFIWGFGFVIKNVGYDKAFLMAGGLGLLACLIVSLPAWLTRESTSLASASVVADASLLGEAAAQCSHLNDGDPA